MLVHLGALVSHAVNTNDALVRADAWTSFGPCLVLLGAPSWHHRGLGAPRCLRQSRFMLVMMGALVLHTIGTSRALVRADVSTSIGPYALCLGALGSHRNNTSCALVLQGASRSLGTCLCF